MTSNMLNQGPPFLTNGLPFVELHILVVDDDSTTVSIVSAMLRNWSYQVVAAKNPLDALSTLRMRKGLFDLVVTDLHMPYMDGFELSTAVEKEFKIPVVMMSANENESMILKCFQYGIAFFIVKPVNPDDLQNVWQYALAGKKGKSVVVDGNIFHGESSGSSWKTSSDQDTMNSVGKLIQINSGRNGNNSKFDPKQMMANYPKNTSDGCFDLPRRPRKTKVIWTSWLHNRFLLAIRRTGLDKAVPKKILEFMNVPGLTRENVASHLQKYRIFLKRVVERGLARGASRTFLDRLSRSSFAAGHPELWLRNLKQSYVQYHRNNPLASEIRPPLMGGANNTTTPSLPLNNTVTSNLSPFPTFPSLTVSSSASRTGQSSLLTNNHRGNFHMPQQLILSANPPSYLNRAPSEFFWGTNSQMITRSPAKGGLGLKLTCPLTTTNIGSVGTIGKNLGSFGGVSGFSQPGIGNGHRVSTGFSQNGFSTCYNGSINGVFVGQNLVGSSSYSEFVGGSHQFAPVVGNTNKPQNSGGFVTRNQMTPVNFSNINQARHMGRFVSATPVNKTSGYNNYLGQGQVESSSFGGFYLKTTEQQNAGESSSASALPSAYDFDHLSHVVGGNNGEINVMSNIPTKVAPGVLEDNNFSDLFPSEVDNVQPLLDLHKKFREEVSTYSPDISNDANNDVPSANQVQNPNSSDHFFGGSKNVEENMARSFHQRLFEQIREPEPEYDSDSVSNFDVATYLQDEPEIDEAVNCDDEDQLGDKNCEEVNT